MSVRTILAAAVAVFSLATAPAAKSDGEHTRRLAAEIAVMLGDAKRLADPGLPDQHRRGLLARLRGGLAPLPLLVRRARQERMSHSPLSQEIFGGLRAALDNGQTENLLAGLQGLAVFYPLDFTGILPAEPTPGRLQRAAEIHETYCAGCHDEPDLEVERPAYNLFDRARILSPQELAARLILGVRGDRLTNLQNPLSDEEIAALTAYYRGGE